MRQLPRASSWLISIWPIALTAVDIGVSTWSMYSTGAASTATDISALALNAISRLLYWLGLFVVVLAASMFTTSSQFPMLQVGARWLFRLALTGTLLYVFFVWAFVVANGHAPSSDAIDFLLDNLPRLPQHVLQTSPLLTIGSTLGAVFAAIITEAAVVATPGVFKYKPTRTLVAGLILITGASAIARIEDSIAIKPVIKNETATPEEDPLVRAYLASLNNHDKKPKTTTVVRKFPTIVILVESLRYDLLTEHPEAIPFLKSLHDREMGFERSYATASHSNLSDLAFWYSQYPLRGRGKESYPTDASWRGTSLFSIFKDAGYRTAYISSQNERWGNMINWLDTPEVNHFFHSEDYQGDTWENMDDLPGLGGMIKRGLVSAGKIEDSSTLRVARDWITTLPSQTEFFLGMNLQNTHFSYVIPPGGIEPYQPSNLGFKAIYYRWPEQNKANVRNRYLNAVANLDRLLAEFAAFLKAKGIWDECIFVVVGDNGEGFYEHGFGNHSGPMYDEAVRTFSVLKLPKSLRTSPRRIGFPVSHIDIAATIPHIAGLPLPGSFQGLPLDAEAEDQRPVFMYSNAIVRQYGIVAWPWKLLVTEFPRTTDELFNLSSDPAEATNVAATYPETTSRLKSQLEFWVKTQQAYYRTDSYTTKGAPRFESRRQNSLE